MGKWLMRLGGLVLAVVVLIVTGCPPQDTEEAPTTPPTSSAPSVAASQIEEPVEKVPNPIDVTETLESLTPATTSIPEVKLPATLKDTCLVAVGDMLPAGEVATVDGEKRAVADLLGKKGTVVFFWTVGSSEIAAKTVASALGDLQGDAQAAHGDKGLAVVAINPKDTPEKVKELLGAAKVSYPVLLDVGGSYFAKVASDKLPRVYVLDASGKIAWFDVGFSETSREVLKQTLQVLLGDPQSAKK